MTRKRAKQGARAQALQRERQEVGEGPYLRRLSPAIQRWQGRATCLGPSLTAMRVRRREEAPSRGQDVDAAGRGSSRPLARSLARTSAAPVSNFLSARGRAPLHACDQTSLRVCLSRLCALCLWFWSPGSQASQGLRGGSPAACEPTQPCRTPEVTERDTHTHTLPPSVSQRNGKWGHASFLET